jgi:hypothetical protein
MHISKIRSIFIIILHKINKNNDIFHSFSKYANRTEGAAKRKKSGYKRKYCLPCKTSRECKIQFFVGVRKTNLASYL